MNVAELCDQHGYPALLRDVLHELADAVRTHLGGLRSVILCGSVATGDFLWRQDGERIELLSDIDAFAFAPPAQSDRAGLRTRLKAIEARTASPHFKIDLSVSPPEALRRVPPVFQMAETHRTGFVLEGKDLRSAFPEHFDPRASRQSFLGNLWKPVGVWLDREADDGCAFSLAASRLLMDIATLEVSEEGLCLPGHKARAERFLSRRTGLLSSDPLLREAVTAAIEARQTPPGTPSRLEPLLAPSVARTVELLDGAGPVPDDPTPELVKRLAGWLQPRTTRRLFGEVRTVTQCPHRPDRDLRWLASRKEAVAGACVLGWLIWLGQGGEGAPPGGVQNLLSVFARRNAPGGEGEAFHREAAAMYRLAWREYSPSAA